MQCPNCEYTVVGKSSGYPSFTHCCETCSYSPGTHGPRCLRIVSAYAEKPRVCPGCQTYMITGISHTACCKWCDSHPGEHGTKCHRRDLPWQMTEEYSTPLRHALLQQELLSPPTPSSSSSSTPPMDRCAYVVLYYGFDAEYALGALLVASSLQRNHVKARLVLLHTKDVPEERLKLLALFYDEVRLIANPVTVPMNSPLCPCSRDFAHSQFLKLHLLELDFDKVLYLDCDIIVRQNLDHLFAMQAPAAMERIMAMPAHGTKLPNRVVYNSVRVRGIQGGVMLLTPDRDLFLEMRQEVEDPEVLRARSELSSSPYLPSIGNEQDYLTWKYCQTAVQLYDQDDHSHSVWTHLGCQYNYEIHQDSTYFGIGRERWLWLDYEKDAAVLHYSAPLAKRAKHLLRGSLHDDSRTESITKTEDECPRIAFGRVVWNEAVAHLQKEVCEKGENLGLWLGEGPDAHRATFEVVPRDGVGMKIVQVTPREDHQSSILTFQVFAANCIDGLHYFPPPFTLGPPWGACFWARKSMVFPYLPCSVGSGSLASRCASSTVEASDVKLSIKEGKEDECVNATASPGVAASVVEITGEFDDTSRGNRNETSASVNGHRKAEALGCNCATKQAGISNYLRRCGSKEDDEEEVGAWLNWQTKDQWEFGRLADPPHLEDCFLWRLHAVFRAKVL